MNYLKKFFTKKNVLIILAVILTGGSFFLAKNAFAAADSYDMVATMVVWLTSWLVHILVYVFGQLLLIAISILIKVCSFNEFVDADIVTTGWVIIRDLANLGIVIMMLVIAFGTTLNKNAYKYQTMLPKLLLSAILINFSKEITGLLISLSQYLMMYFVHAFENIAAGNITYGLGIDDMLSVRKAVRSAGGGAEINDWNVLGALIMSMVMLAVALGVVLTMALMLLRRIVAFWMLLITSPIYFVADLIPPVKEYASKWKKELTDNLVKGPTLAFMFWLSMTVLSKITDQNRIINLQMQSQQAASGGALSTTDYAFFASKMSSPQRVFDYLITIILFFFTMGIAKGAGGMAGKFASTYSGKLDKVGKWFSSRPGKIGGATVNTVKRSKLGLATGVGINKLKDRLPKSFTKEGRELNYQKRKAEIDESIGGKTGAVGRLEWNNAMKKRKENEDAGAYRTLNDVRKKIDSNNLSESLAAIQYLASKKELTEEDTKKFKDKFGRDEKQLKHLDAAWRIQQDAGDKTAVFKKDVKEEDGRYYERSPEDKVADIKKTYGDMKTSELGDSIKSVSGLSYEDKAAHEFINIVSGRTENLGRIDPQQRKTLLSYIEKTIAADAANPSKVFGNNQATRENFVKTRNILKMMDKKGTKVYDNRSGKVEDELVKFAENSARGIGSTSNEYGAKLIYDISDDFSMPVSEGNEFINNIIQESIKKEEEKGKIDRVKGKYQESSIQKEIRKGILSDPNLKTLVEEITMDREQIRRETDETQRAVLINRFNSKMSGLITNLKADMQSGKISYINPLTNQNYTGDDLVKEFEKTDMHKNMMRTVTEKKSDSLLNVIDSFVIDIQDSASWKDRAKAKIGFGSTPEEKQKARQEILVTSKKLSTGFDALKGPQTRGGFGAAMGKVSLGAIKSSTNEEKRVNKIMKNLETVSGAVKTEVLEVRIQEMRNMYDQYKKASGTDKLNLVERMQEKLKEITNNFEVKK